MSSLVKTYISLVPHICVSELELHWFREWYGAYYCQLVSLSGGGGGGGVAVCVCELRWWLLGLLSVYYTDVIMGAMMSQITSVSSVCSSVCSGKKTSKLRVTGLCEGNSPVNGEFPSQRTSNVVNVSIWWRHHAPTTWRTLCQGLKVFESMDREGRAHYSDVIMSAMMSQITGVSIVCSTVCLGADQRKHQSSASLAFVRGLHRDRWIPRIKCQ